MDRLNIVGTIAAICTTAAFFPQVFKIYKTRHVRDLSLPMYVIFSFGVFSWMIYGFMAKSIPIIIANLVTFTLSIYILCMIILHRKEQ